MALLCHVLRSSSSSPPPPPAHTPLAILLIFCMSRLRLITVSRLSSYARSSPSIRSKSLGGRGAGVKGHRSTHCIGVTAITTRELGSGATASGGQLARELRAGPRRRRPRCRPRRPCSHALSITSLTAADMVALVARRLAGRELIKWVRKAGAAAMSCAHSLA